MNDNIFKVWGERRRVFLNDGVEIDHLFIKKDHFCSIHRHDHKSNRFYVISGKLKVESDIGNVELGPNEVFDVHAPYIHRFIALEDTVIIEVAYVKIDPGDIRRNVQGGKIINGEEYTEDQLRKEGKLDL